jgi:serralysin
MIDRFVRAAQEAGIPIDSVVPTFQSFGGGEWRADSGGGYRLPSSDEMQSMFERWKNLTPKPVFDYAYSWGMQRSDDSLATSPELQAAFARHNVARSAAQ